MASPAATARVDYCRVLAVVTAMVLAGAVALVTMTSWAFHVMKGSTLLFDLKCYGDILIDENCFLAKCADWRAAFDSSTDSFAGRRASCIGTRHE